MGSLRSSLVFVLSNCIAASTAFGKVNYNFEVRPILSAKCFGCHGSDKKDRKADLRLDDREAALKSGTIIPGKPEKSELITRLYSTDPEEIMPPPEKHQELTPAQKDTLKRWIAEGAHYDPHWAFQPPKAPEQKTVDEIVAHALEKKGWKPASPAMKPDWLRRVTFALTGLPPTVEEVGAYAADTSEDAAAKVVDRLLASPRYGERMAAIWLDAARFGDTYGRHEDMETGMWPWRDWVINAFNKNLPYDTFITYQLAGDLLPGATQEQRLATGFSRLPVMTNEAGSDPEENRWMIIFDRVHTTSTALMGLTMECAQCHDHKFDPLSMKDYYQMAAFFDKGDELGLFPRYCNSVPPPSMFIYRDQQAEHHQQLKQAITTAEQRWEKSKLEAKTRFQDWLKKFAPPGQGQGLWDSLTVAGTSFRPTCMLPEPELYVGFEAINHKENAYIVGDVLADTLEGSTPPKGKSAKGRIGFAAEFLDGRAARYLFPPKYAHYRRTDPFSFSLWLKLDRHPERGVILHRCRAGLDANHRGYELMFLDGKLTASLCHSYPGNAIRIQAREKHDFSKMRHLCWTYDGSSRASGIKLYVDGELLPTTIVRDNLYRDIDYLDAWRDNDRIQVADGTEVVPRLMLGARVLDTGLQAALADELHSYSRELSRPEIRILAHQKVTEPPDAWLEWYCREIDRNCRETLAAVRAARIAENEFNIKLQETMIMEDSPQMTRQTTILARGDFRTPSEPVQPGTPVVLPPMPASAPKNRLGLAQWLTHPNHPLTSRVQANRLWAMFFGQSLTATPHDLGLQGQPPALPELLDYLAVRLQNLNWDLKALCREIALSKTYGQSSLPADKTLWELDPDNQFLARGPRFRLPAEQLRDAALAASGLLKPTLGGPSVKPYQPIGLWEDSGTQHAYVPDKGDALYRRSLYTFWRRTCPPPTMSVFDAPTREFCVINRDRTMTPLQVLAVLNDTGFLETARVLAELVTAEFPLPNQVTERVQMAYRKLTGNLPSPAQSASLTALILEGRTYYEATKGEAEKFLTATGASPLRPGLPPSEIAATLLMTRAILNAEPFLSSY